MWHFSKDLKASDRSARWASWYSFAEDGNWGMKTVRARFSKQLIIRGRGHILKRTQHTPNDTYYCHIFRSSGPSSPSIPANLAWLLNSSENLASVRKDETFRNFWPCLMAQVTEKTNGLNSLVWIILISPSFVLLARMVGIFKQA